MRRTKSGDHFTFSPTTISSLGIGHGPAWFHDDTRACSPRNPDPVHPDLFFQDDTVDEAKRVCRRCPFRWPCDEWAAQHRERWGVWGGRHCGPRSAANRPKRKPADAEVAA